MTDSTSFIFSLTPSVEDRIRRNHSLNMDTFIIPSPFIRGESLEKDYEHSYYWEEEGEILGYLFVYSDPQRMNFHLYKQATSPFGRGKGIGTAFIKKLAASVDPGALLYLYIWEKHQEAALFFAKKGFAAEGGIVYRGLTFNSMQARARDVMIPKEKGAYGHASPEEIGKTRHDARKTLKLLSDMVDKLNAGNCNRLIEDINRESTALVNMLNAYRDATEYFHEFNIKNLIIERILPFIEMSQRNCEARLIVKGKIPEVFGHYLDAGRALINLASNAQDAIAESGRKGRITLSLEARKDAVRLVFKDNGIGIEPRLLVKGEDGVPLFVGRTTKTGPEGRGQGLGTRQIFATFGKNNIRVSSVRGKGTTWTIRLAGNPSGDVLALKGLESRFSVFKELVEEPVRGGEPDRQVVASFIWRLRKKEVLAWDLILQFSKYNNIRDIYRLALAFLHGGETREDLAAGLAGCRIDHGEIREWLEEMLGILKRDKTFLDRHAGIAEYGAIMLKSYGQATDRTIIFTLDPESGKFFATDRKLAEHVDFAPYLGKDREELLRGELRGDLNAPESPLMLGVWTVRNEGDALAKLRLLRQGARKLVGLGIKPSKKLSFYQTTYVSGTKDVDSYLATTLGDFMGTPDEELGRFLAEVDEDAQSFIVTD